MNTQTGMLGIDIGGTSLKSAIVNSKKGAIVGKTVIYKSPQPSTVTAMLKICENIKSDFAWDGPVGIGFPGIVKHNIAYSAPNLSELWVGINLQEQFGSVFTSGLSIINDADAAGLAEMKFGSGQKWNIKHGGTVFFITLGTGIGSALFINGQLVPNMEFGHIQMDGVEAEKLAATVVREKENLSWAVWGKRVNQYLNMMSELLSPDGIIIGGGVSASPEKFFKYIDVNAEILPAKMGNAAGIVGAVLPLLN